MGKNLRVVACGLKRYAFAIVGLSLFCMLLRQPYFGNVIEGQLPSAHFARAVLDGLVLTLGIAAAIVGRRLENGNLFPHLPLAGAVLLALGVGAFAVLRYVDSGEWLAFAGALLCSAGFVMLAFTWLRLLIAVPDDLLVPLAMLSFTLSLLAGFIDAIDGPARVVVNALVPACSALCAIRAGRVERGQSEEQTSSGSSHIYLLIVMALTVEVVCCSLVRGTWSSGGVGYAGTNAHRMLSYLVSAAIGVVFFLVAALAKRPERSGVAISVVSLVGVIALLIALAVGGWSIASSFVTSLYSALLVVLLAVLASASRGKFVRPSIASGTFCAVFGAISFVSYTMIPGPSAYDRASSTELLLPMALAAALVIVVGEFVVMIARVHAQAKALKNAMGDASSEDLWNGIAVRPGVAAGPARASEEDALTASVDRAAELYRLTTREADVVKLLAQGYTIKRTAEELYLAPSTVQGYTKSIYAKMGIHGKGEIRDLLAELAE